MLKKTQISFLFTCCLSDRHCPLGFTSCPNQVLLHPGQKVPGRCRPLQNLCCVDKKGVLSWPNPTTEKVFFPQEQSTQPHNYQLVLSPCIVDDGMFEEIKLERNSSLQHNQRK
ncbi:hypothetical protein Pcinc_004755 [Petrolisthes cinctipes]|uniref:Uncharacterized protein n=1 Tax=Petrolisthes cinctipes TaxID=88211 RepID=A0AAE1GGH4_PETCI|nr:hypothetical protein Pcinc_004755 [Petrolisthes cinctipes]